MTDAVRPNARPGSPDLLDDLESSNITFGGMDIFERIWHLFISMRTGLALILVLAFLTLVGTLVVQAPPGLSSDREAYAAWLEGAARPKYGGWTGIFDAVGFFSVFNSVLFRSLTVLLSTSILACSINRAPKLWKQAVHPRTTMSSSFFAHAALRARLELPHGVERSSGALEQQLRSAGYRIIRRQESGGVDIYADRFRWGPFGTVAAHLSIILIVVGALLGAGGFRDDRLTIPVGSTMDVGNGTALSVQAVSFMDSYYTSGAPSDYASHLVLYDNGQQVADQTIRVNEPLRYGDITFYQSYFGAAADLEIKDASGAVVYNRGVPLEFRSNDGVNAIGELKLPAQGVTVYVVAPASGTLDPEIPNGTMQIEVVRSGVNTLIGTQLVAPGEPAAIGSLTYTFLRERQFTGLIVARDPGVMFVWAGSLFLVLGVWLVFYFPNRRIWARVRPGESGSVVEAGALTRHDVMFEAAFTKLITNAQLELERPGAAS